jgi:hypothetical protein
MAARFIGLTSLVTGGIVGYSTAKNILIPYDLRVKYMGCATLITALSILPTGLTLGGTLPVAGIGALVAVPATLLTYGAGYQVGKIVYYAENAKRLA